MFGHEAGSFTGAAKTRHGRFEEADGGTLFLDELATLSSPAQDRLLRAVEYGEVTRIGASRPISVDVRIVAATNEHLPRLVDQGRFRADLLDRLSFEVVTLAAAARPRRATSRCSPSISAGAWRSSWNGPTGPASAPTRCARWSAYAWPGNVRELRNVVERAVYRHEDPERPIDQIQFDPFASPWAAALGSGGEPHLPPVGMTAEPLSDGPSAAAPPPAPASEDVGDFRGAVTAFERRILEDALARNRYNQKATATALGLSYDQLRHALKRHELLNAAPS